MSGSGTSQSLIDSLIAEAKAPLPGDETRSTEASTESLAGSNPIAASGGGESPVGTATVNVDHTVTTATVNLTASTVDEGAGVDYVFTATLSDASHGVTTIHTDQGDITIADGQTTGTLTIAANNGEDVYADASSLTASHHRRLRRRLREPGRRHGDGDGQRVGHGHHGDGEPHRFDRG